MLSQSCFGHFLAFWHFRKVWLPCKQEKQTFCSATYLALCVAFFSLNTEQFQSACCPLHSEHGGNLVFSLFFSSLELTLVLPASTFVTTFCLTGCSTLTKDFNRSWPSALFLSQSLKSSNVNRCQCCLTKCMDHASFRFGGSLLTAWFNRFTLFKSSLNDKDLKTATSPEITTEKLITWSELCIFNAGKFFNLSKCAPTTTWGCPNFLWRVARASLYNTPL